MEVITVNGDQALWEALAASLREDITAGRLGPNDPIPTEEELAQEWATSRTTVRRALLSLENEGLITEGRGRLGRRVRDAKQLVVYASRSESLARAEERQPLGVDAWVADATEQEFHAGQRILVETAECPLDVARWLEIEPASRVIVRRRVRTLDGKPHNLADTFYPADIAEGTRIALPADVPEGVINYMRTLGHVQVRGEDDVTARMPSPEEGRVLRIPKGVPVIVVYRTGYTSKRPVKVTKTIWPADRTRIRWQTED